MSLQDELDALRAEFVRSAPPGRAALYDAKVDELRRRDRSDSSQTTQGVAIRCGTGSSNPALSTGESANPRSPLETIATMIPLHRQPLPYQGPYSSSQRT